MLPSLTAPAGRILRFSTVLLAGFFALASEGAERPPAVRVENIRRVFHNGEHNAFTDLIRWRDRYWLAFRSSPEGHAVNANAAVIVLSSADARTWVQAHRFSVPQRDTRDPHFLIFKDQLFIYSGTWYAGRKLAPGEKHDFNQHLGVAVWTADGVNWAGPRRLEGTYGHYIWRAAAFDGKAYLCGRRTYAGGLQSALLESDDGLIWKFRSLFQPEYGNETAFVIADDGEITSLSRKTNSASDLGRSRPPYTEWSRQEIPEFIGGPLLVRWGKWLMAGGRRVTPGGPQTTLSWVIDGRLRPFAELPSGGDNSYPGFVELVPGRGLVSWYSSHEKGADGKPITAIYLAELALQN
jgi:hypothetical protein